MRHRSLRIAHNMIISASVVSNITGDGGEWTHAATAAVAVGARSCYALPRQTLNRNEKPPLPQAFKTGGAVVLVWIKGHIYFFFRSFKRERRLL